MRILYTIFYYGRDGFVSLGNNLIKATEKVEIAAKEAFVDSLVLRVNNKVYVNMQKGQYDLLKSSPQMEFELYELRTFKGDNDVYQLVLTVSSPETSDKTISSTIEHIKLILA